MYKKRRFTTQKASFFDTKHVVLLSKGRHLSTFTFFVYVMLFYIERQHTLSLQETFNVLINT